MKTLILSLIVFSTQTFAQECATPMDCYQVEQEKKAEQIRLKQEREDAAFRAQQLRIQEAQLQELQAQRQVMEEDLKLRQEEQMEREEQHEETNQNVNPGGTYALPGNEE